MDILQEQQKLDDEIRRLDVEGFPLSKLVFMVPQRVFDELCTDPRWGHVFTSGFVRVEYCGLALVPHSKPFFAFALKESVRQGIEEEARERHLAALEYAVVEFMAQYPQLDPKLVEQLYDQFCPMN